MTYEIEGLTGIEHAEFFGPDWYDEEIDDSEEMNRFDFVIINGEEYQVIEPATGLVYHVPTRQNITFGDLRDRARFIRRQRRTQWWEIVPSQASATPLLDARAAKFFDLYTPWGGG